MSDILNIQKQTLSCNFLHILTLILKTGSFPHSPGMTLYLRHMDKTEVGQDQGWEVGMAGVWGSGREELETTVLQQQQQQQK